MLHIMAELLSGSKGLITTYDPKEITFDRSKWQTKKQLRTAIEVSERIAQMRFAKRTSCPWSIPRTEIIPYDEQYVSGINGASLGTDWHAHFNLLYKAWSQYKEYIEGRSNLKSPISFAPVEAAMAEFQENETGVILNATTDEDKQKVKVYTHLLKHVENIGDFSEAKASSFHECLILGTSVAEVAFITKEREVEIMLTDKAIDKAVDKIIGSKNADKIAELKQKANDKKPLTEKQTITEYDDVAYIPISMYEFYVDPSARYLRGFSHEAVDCAVVTTPSLEQFRAMYRNHKDPYIIQANIDKVVPAADAVDSYGNEKRFFKLPGDISKDSDKVELARYFNKQTDKYIVKANDIIVRDGPLPYNHKELPFVVHKLIEFPGQFYGMGLVDILESLQAEDETLRNLYISQLKINLARPLFINSDVFADVDSGWNRVEEGLKIEVAGDVGPNNIRWMDSSGSMGEYFQLRKQLLDDATMASGINPLIYSMATPHQPVRNNMLTIESSLKMVKKGIKNWAKGYKEAVRQMIAIIQQKYPDAYVAKLDGEGNVIGKQYKTIKVNGESLSAGPDGELQSNQIPGYTFFEAEPRYLDLAGDIDIELNVDTLLPISQALEMQKIEQAFGQLFPVLGNPQLLNSPGVADLVRDYVQAHGLSEKITEKLNDTSSSEEIGLAQEQNSQMFNMMPVEGLPGRSDAHVIVHASKLIQLITLVQTPPPNMSVQQLPVIQHIISLMATHLQTDMVPMQSVGDAALKQAQDFNQQMNPQMQQGMNPQPPMMGGPQGPMGAPQGPMGMPPGGGPPMAGGRMVDQNGGPVDPQAQQAMSGIGMGQFGGISGLI